MRSCCCDPTPPGCELSFNTDIYIGYKDGTEVNLADLRAKFSGTPTGFNEIFWEKSKGIPSYINVVIRKSDFYAYHSALTWTCGPIPPKLQDIPISIAINDSPIMIVTGYEQTLHGLIQIPHNLQTGDQLVISDSVLSPANNTEENPVWTVTVVDFYRFTLDKSTAQPETEGGAFDGGTISINRISPPAAADVAFEFSIGDKVKYKKYDATTASLDVFSLSHTAHNITCFKNNSSPHNPNDNFKQPATQDVVVPDVAFELAQDVVNLYFGGTAGWSEREFSFKTKPDFDAFFADSDMQSYSMKIWFSNNVTERNFSEVDVSLSSDKVSAITGASGLDVSPIEIIAGAHGFRNGDEVQVSEVTGNTAANGNFTITYINPYKFSLNCTTGNGDYTGGGVVKINRKVLLFTNTFNVAGSSRDHRYKLGGWLYNYGISDDEGRRLANILTGREELPTGIPGDTVPEVTVVADQPETDSRAEIAPPSYFNEDHDYRPPGFGLAHGGGTAVKLTTYNSYYKDQQWGVTTPKLLKDIAKDPLYVYGGAGSSPVERGVSIDGTYFHGAYNNEWDHYGKWGAMAAPTNVVRMGYGTAGGTFQAVIESNTPRPFYGNWINGYDTILTITKIYKWKEEGSLSGRIVDREETIVHEVNVGKQAYVHAVCDPIVALCAGAEKVNSRAWIRPPYDPAVSRSNIAEMGFMCNLSQDAQIANIRENKVVTRKTPLIDSKTVKGRIDGVDDIRERCDVPIPTPEPSREECVGNINDETFDKTTCFTQVTGTTDTENDDGETETSDILETTCYKCWDNYAEYQADYLSKINGIKIYKEYTAYGTVSPFSGAGSSQRDDADVRCLDKPGHTLHVIRGKYSHDLDNWPQYLEVPEFIDGHATGNKSYHVNYWSPYTSAPSIYPLGSPSRMLDVENYLPTHKWSFQCDSGKVQTNREAHPDCYWHFPQEGESNSTTPDRYKNLEFITSDKFHVYSQNSYSDFEIQDYISQFPAVFYIGWAYEAATNADCGNLFGGPASYQYKTTGYKDEPSYDGTRQPIVEVTPPLGANDINWTKSYAYLTTVTAAKSGFELFADSSTYWTAFSYADEITNPTWESPTVPTTFEEEEEEEGNDGGRGICSVDIKTPDADYVQDNFWKGGPFLPKVGPSVGSTPFGVGFGTTSTTVFSTNRIFTNDLLSNGSHDLSWNTDLDLIPVPIIVVAEVNDEYSNGNISAQTDTSEYWLQNSSQSVSNGKAFMVPPVLPRNDIDPWNTLPTSDFCPFVFMVTSGTRQVGVFGFDTFAMSKDKYCTQKWLDNAFVNSEYSFKVETNFTTSENKIICRGNDDSTVSDDCTYVPSIDVTTTKCLRKKSRSGSDSLAIGRVAVPAQIFNPTSTTGPTVYAPFLSKMDCPDGDAYDTFDCIDQDNRCHDNERARDGRDWTLQDNSITITGTAIDPYITFSDTTTFNTEIDLDGSGVLVEVQRNGDCNTYFEFASKLNVIGKGKGDCKSAVHVGVGMPISSFHYTRTMASDIMEWKTVADTPFGNSSNLGQGGHPYRASFKGDLTVCTDLAYCSSLNSACIETGASCTQCGGSNNEHVIPTIKEGNMSQSILTCKGVCPPGLLGVSAGNCATTTFKCATCGTKTIRPLKAEIKGLCENSRLPVWKWDGGTNSVADLFFPNNYVDEATDHEAKNISASSKTITFESLLSQAISASSLEVVLGTNMSRLLPSKLITRNPLECHYQIRAISDDGKEVFWNAFRPSATRVEHYTALIDMEYVPCCNKANC